jgi:hypothetical protein
MKTGISISDFSFKLAGYGHYLVTYTSPATGKQWSKTISDMSYTDKTLRAENPKKVDLNRLKKIVKC